MFALALVPILVLVGMAVDYTVAADRQAQVDAIADAAALAAVASPMMAQSDAAASSAAQNTFNAQAGKLTGTTQQPRITYSPSNLTVSVTTNAAGIRTAVVSYTASSPTFFARLLGQSAITFSSSSTAMAGQPPNIDFYLLLDDSPSMGIAATQAGIQTMVNNTLSQGGCAFACHESNPAADNLGNPNGEDNYALARNLGVTLRIDLLGQAVQNLMSTAQTTENNTTAQYRMGIYTFDVNFNTIASLTSNLGAAQTAAGNITQMEVYSNNWLTSSNNNDDEDTDYDNAMSQINQILPNPGSGTNIKGDTPQEVMFFVTDGVEDEDVSGGRQQSLMDPTWCTTIKNRGIRIAVLYTVYYPLPTNSWYNTYVAPFQTQIGPTLQSCASPGLFFQVDTGGDISAALTALFQTAVQSAYLSK